MSRPVSAIAALNDAMRRAGPQAGTSGNRWLLTDGIHSHGSAFAVRAIQSVMSFDTFTADNDPHGEHDFGTMMVAGERLFWKIDYYDLSSEYGSSDPTNPAVTRRVLTVMFASEY